MELRSFGRVSGAIAFLGAILGAAGVSWASVESDLAAIPGVKSVKWLAEPSTFEVQVFEVGFEQKVDHQHPGRGTFLQKLIVHHRSVAEPVVLQTSGYSIFAAKPTAIMQTFATNQIQVEHRFFERSTPQNPDWHDLTVEQSAADFHAITQAFKSYYKAHWVGTGASKGGMTSVFHRRFYPEDLNGTVADVAPLSYTRSDPRYIDFVDQVGGEKYASCRAKLQALQLSLLGARESLVAKIEGNFSHLGSADLAFEHAITEFPFIFWQYQNPKDEKVGCDALPVGASIAKQYEWMTAVNPISDYTNEKIAGFMPYYFQAGVELGNPGNLVSHLQGLLRHPFTIEQYMPAGTRDYAYTDATMRDVEAWVRDEAEGILFIYGELDPWTAGQYPASDAGRDVTKLFVPGGNHGSKFFALPEVARQEAVAKLTQWLGKEPVPAVGGPGLLEGSPGDDGETLEDVEFRLRRRQGL